MFKSFNNIWSPIVALLFGSAVFLILFAIAFNNTRLTEEQVFNFQSQRLNDEVRKAGNNVQSLSTRLQALFHSSEFVDVDEFRVISQDVLNKYNYITATYYSPLIDADERLEFEAEQKFWGLYDYQIFGYDADGEKSQVQRRDQYLPITFVEPFSAKTSTLLGFDLASSEELLLGVRQTVALGEPYAVVKRANIGTLTTDFRLLIATYQGKEIPSTKEDKLDSYNGIVSIDIDAAQFFNDIELPEGVSFTLSMEGDASDSEQVMMSAKGQVRDEGYKLFDFINLRRMDIGNRTFLLTINKAVYSNNVDLRVLWMAIAVGLLIILALFSLSRSKINLKQELLRRLETEKQLESHRAELEVRVAERTQQLSERESKLRESDEVFQKLSSSALIAIIIIDNDGNVSFWNNAAETIFGWTSDEAMGRNLHSLIVPAQMQKDYFNAFPSFQKTGQGPMIGKTLELQAQRKNGSTLYVEASLSSVQIKGRWCAIGMVSDITDRKRAENDLLKSETQLRSVFENSPGGIIHLDAAGTIVNVNDRALEIFDVTRDEVIGENTLEHVTDSALLDCIHSAIKGEKSIFEDYYTSVISGKSSYLRAVFNPVILDGQNLEVIGSMEDISEIEQNKKQLEQQLEELKVARQSMMDMMKDLDKARASAEAATQAKSDFLANMSHEIRTPMNAIIGMTYLVMKTELSHKQQDYIGKIEQSANSLLGIINDILDFSKIEAGKLSIENSEFQLDAVIDELGNLLSVQNEGKDVELLFRVANDVPRKLMGDPLRLGQVLLNLASNAVKFTEQGEILISVAVKELKPSSILLDFSVKDTGIGISSEQQKKLFQSFSQADSSTTRKFGGTGLGLVISKKLVEMMGGSIAVSSELGEGSEFSFTIAFDRSQTQVSSAPLLKHHFNNLRILIVDDNETSRNILSESLEIMGCEVDLAESGYQAIELLKKCSFRDSYDLVLMDWKMPELDGIETSRLIMQDKQIVSVPTIIMISAYDQEQIVEQAREIGVRDFLSKPVNQSTLFNSVAKVLDSNARLLTEPVGLNQSTEGAPYFENCNVLLAEDNELNQQVARELLSDMGIDVTIASNGNEAVEFAKLYDFDLVLMDIQMPVMDGLEATKQIKRIDKCAQWPIVAMTAHAMSGDKDKSLEAGMIDHINKPIEPSVLNRVLREHLKHRLVNISKKTSVSSSETSYKQSIDTIELPGINVSEGLKRLFGKETLYRELLVKFANEQERVDEMISKDLADENMEQAIRSAHTLCGVSATLGANELSSIAKELELKLSSGDSFEVDDDLSRLADELSVVVSGIRTLINNNEVENSESGDENSNRTQLLLEMSASLDQDFSEAKDQKNAFLNALKNCGVEAELQLFEQAMDEFDSDTAQETISKISMRLGLKLEG